MFVTDIGFFPRAKYHYRERKGGCDSYIVLFCVGGKGWIYIKGKRQTMEKNNIIVLPPNIDHTYGSDEQDPWSIYWFHIKGKHSSYFFPEHILGQGVILPPNQAQRFIELFYECYGLLERGYYINNLIGVSQAMGHLLSHIFIHKRQSSAELINHDMAEYAIQIMLDHIDSSLTLKELAEQTNLSKPHLIQVFKKQTGYTPIDYYLRLKIQRACQYLDLSDWTVKEICIQLGFNDPYYFSRLFRKIMGLSPSKYRLRKKG
ncbi:AraC family transcriptional regulator [Neobacillus niacini]|uniref:AraC family transcriptional regulator n=1 Tax=Neobacillus niacini TaxID=86668 RepID=UPI003000A8FA